MGIDLIAGGRNKKTARTAPKSDNVYLKLLVKVGHRFGAILHRAGLLCTGTTWLSFQPSLLLVLTLLIACSSTASW